MDFANASKSYYIQSTWGYKDQTTGIYSGMIGDLQTGVADLGGKQLKVFLRYFSTIAFQELQLSSQKIVLT